MSLYPSSEDGHLAKLDEAAARDADTRRDLLACPHPRIHADRCTSCGAVVIDLGVRR